MITQATKLGVASGIMAVSDERKKPHKKGHLALERQRFVG